MDLYLSRWGDVDAKERRQFNRVIGSFQAVNGHTDDFRDVTYGNGLFVAVGDIGEIQTSPDGIVWTKRTADQAYAGYFYAAEYDNDVYIVAGSSSEIQVSSDGINWTKQILDSTDSWTFRDICFGNGKLIVIASDGDRQILKRPFHNIVGKEGNASALGYYDEFRVTSGENVTAHTFQPRYYLEYESYENWFRRTRPLDSKHLGLDTYSFSGDCPSTIPIGYRLPSSDTNVASRLGHRTFIDINDPHHESYYVYSGIDTYEEYY